METPPSFGKRGVVGAAQTRIAPVAPPPRRWRSQTVAIGAIGAIALGGMAAAEWRQRQCEPRRSENAEAVEARTGQAETEKRPSWCDSHGHGGGGRGFWSWGGHGGGGSFGDASGHASFGGFGAHGSGHGGG